MYYIKLYYSFLQYKLAKMVPWLAEVLRELERFLGRTG